MTAIRAEIISIGDEITSGSLQDTNTIWIARRLREAGIVVAFHTTVGDDMADNVDVFQTATGRVDLVISTGGLGPTADDLTRQAIAEMADVPLKKEPFVLENIKAMYARRRRPMPANNEIQSLFPEGSTVIDNPEGTAPGIDFRGTHSNRTDYRIFAIPGVPAEMKQMWALTVGPEIKKHFGGTSIFHQHTIQCFGTGESQIESMLPNLIQRGRDPQVGITATDASISLRLSTNGTSKEHCNKKMRPTIDLITNSLGNLIFGHGDDDLQSVVVALLLDKKQTIAVADFGLNGSVAELMSQCDADGRTILGNAFETDSNQDIQLTAEKIAKRYGATFGLSIGPIDREQAMVESGKSYYDVVIYNNIEGKFGTTIRRSIQFIGHSSYREVKAAKEVLNFVRLHLLEPNV